MAGVGKKKNYKRKIEMSRIAFTTYEKVLVELRSALRGDSLNKQEFIDRMKLIDEMIIDQTPIADRFAKKYNKKFMYKVSLFLFELSSFEVSSFLSIYKIEMIKIIVAYVNFYFPTYKTQFYCENFIRGFFVYQFLYAKYFTQKLDINQIIYRLSDARHSCRSNSSILANHLIFSLAFRAFWEQYCIGRGCVYVTNTSFKEFEVLGYLTGIVYWRFNRGVV